MKACSFVIPFHTSRLANLEQMLRLLERREPLLSELDPEFVLVCHDDGDETIKVADFPVRIIKLDTQIYHRAKACNLGVSLAVNPLIFLLDSDRVLPHCYFYRTAELMQEKEVRYARVMYSLQTLATDSQIERGRYIAKPDHKSATVEFHKKNAFSGNTAIYKDDYLSFGGMDESYIGYGYQDNDASMAAVRSGCSLVPTEDQELHLYHPEQMWATYVCDDKKKRHAYLMINMVRYANKWDLVIPEKLAQQAINVMNQPENYTEQLSDAMAALLKDRGIFR